jgi:hypothetical protein
MSIFQVNDPDVSAELFDNEVLAINLASGHYHSMRFSTVPFWLLITSGYTPDHISEQISKCYNADHDLVNDDLNLLLNELIKNQLIKVRDPQLAAEQCEFQKFCIGKYERPALENYSDMKDLILLDPIHEVDIIGWPHKAPADDKN